MWMLILGAHQLPPNAQYTLSRCSIMHSCRALQLQKEHIAIAVEKKVPHSLQMQASDLKPDVLQQLFDRACAAWLRLTYIAMGTLTKKSNPRNSKADAKKNACMQNIGFSPFLLFAAG